MSCQVKHWSNCIATCLTAWTLLSLLSRSNYCNSNVCSFQSNFFPRRFCTVSPAKSNAWQVRKLSAHRWNEQKWANSPKIYSLNSSGCAYLQSSVNNHSTHSSVERYIVFSFNSVWGSTIIISNTHNTWILMDYLTDRSITL